MLFQPPVIPSTVPTPQPKLFKITKSKQELEEEWKEGEATAYYNGKDRMNGESGVTASGYDLDNGYLFKGKRILATDKSIPFGTLIDIKLRNGDILHGVAMDRGGAIHGNRIDIVYPSLGDCLDFGRQDMKWKIVGRIDVN